MENTERMKKLSEELDLHLAKIHIDERSVFYFCTEIRSMKEEDRECYQRALVELMSERMIELSDGVEELEQQLEEEMQIPEDEVRRLLMCGDAIYDYGEEYYLLCRDSELDLPRVYCQMATELTDKVIKAVENQHKVNQSSFRGALIYKVRAVEIELEAMPIMTSWGSIALRGLLTLLCLLGIAGLFYLPVVQDFLDGRWLTWVANSFTHGELVMKLLQIGAGVAFIYFWIKQDFLFAVSMQFVLALFLAIPVAVILGIAFFWGTGMAERLIVAAVLAYCAYRFYEMIPYDVSINRDVRKTIKKMKEELSYLIPYARLCKNHGVQIGAGDEIIRYYDDFIQRLEKAERGFSNPIITW